MKNLKSKDEKSIFLEEDPIYEKVVSFAINKGKISTSLIQRQFKIGYNRAVKCMDLLEKQGIVGPANGLKPREILVRYKN